MRYILGFLLLFTLLSCSKEVKLDTSPYEKAPVVDSPGVKPKEKRVAQSVTFSQRDYYDEIPKSQWVDGPVSPLDSISCDRSILRSPDKKGLQRIMKANSGKLMACYKTGLVKNIKLSGKVSVAFIVRGDTTVKSCAVTTHIEDKEVGNCFCKEILKMKGFQAPHESGCRNRYNYSIRLNPPN
jgi:hypothetical protein